MQWAARILDDLTIAPQSSGFLNACCHTFWYVVKRYGLTGSNDSTGKFEITSRATITAIVAIMGPIAFSTKDENRNASDATTHIDKIPRPYARAKRGHICDSGKMVSMSRSIASKSPLPKINKPSPTLRTAIEATSDAV